MNKTTLRALIAVGLWFIVGIFSLVNADIFYTGLIAFILGGYMVLLDDEETKKKQREIINARRRKIKYAR